ncbi:MAG: hypothetical protein EP332_15055 [Bacteroidetes bacterium]|nr:MAG: hypothetical protein EP332_15055 [Bacteroidota bacterium]
MKTPTLKLWALPLLFMTFALAIQSCQKDPIHIGPDPTGCENQGTVAYLPKQCASGLTTEIGILGADGKHYGIREDRTGEFNKLNVGDKISFGYANREEGCFVCLSCECPNPDYCISLTCVNGTKPIPVCGTGTCDIPAKVVNYSYSEDGNPVAGRLVEINGKHYLVEGNSANTFNQLSIGEEFHVSYIIITEGYLPAVMTYPRIDGSVELTCIKQNGPKDNF